MDKDGLPLSVALFPANIHDSKTYKPTVEDFKINDEIKAYILQPPSPPPEVHLTKKQHNTLNFIKAKYPGEVSKGTIEVGLNFHPNEAARILKQLFNKGLINEHLVNRYNTKLKRNIVLKNYSLVEN